MFELGIYFTKGRRNEVLEVPESIGRFMTRNQFIFSTNEELKRKYGNQVVKSKSCDKLKEGITEYISDIQKNTLEKARCFDSQHAVLKGVPNDGDFGMFFQMYFEGCH